MIFDDYKVTLHILGDEVDIGSILHLMLTPEQLTDFRLFISGYIEGKEAFNRELQESKK